jgi:uncharacterized cupredoxin-like copper-binding protein
VTAPSPRRPPGPLRRAAPWALAALVLLSIGLPTAGAVRLVHFAPAIGYAAPAANQTITVNLTDAPAFAPQFPVVPEGTNVTFHLVNVGNYTHSFTLAAVPSFTLDPTWSPQTLDAWFAANGSLANVSVAAGAQGWANVTFNDSTALDFFEFVSIVPYQFQSGMWGQVNVSSTGPGLLLTESTVNTPAFVPDTLAALNATDYPISIDVLVTNQGTDSHTFTLVPQSNVTLTPANFTAYFLAHPPLSNVNVPAQGGGTVWANFTVKAPGIYQYLCEIPGHFASGMDGLLYVGVTPPPPAPTPSTAIVDEWLLVGAGVLLGVGGLVAAVAAYAGRFPPGPKTPHGPP